MFNSIGTFIQDLGSVSPVFLLICDLLNGVVHVLIDLILNNAFLLTLTILIYSLVTWMISSSFRVLIFRFLNLINATFVKLCAYLSRVSLGLIYIVAATICIEYLINTYFPREYCKGSTSEVLAKNFSTEVCNEF